MPPITCTNNDSTLVFPIIVLQVTVFPNNGLCIGITIRHVIDGREVIKNPVGVKDTFFRDYFQWRKTWSEALIGKTTDDYYAKPNHENAAKSITGPTN
ncbi:Anthocyanin 5-aromatic acyltransferase [Quillaja saponaria]|uniref:Anthocyanin 5-aromatic acyltransferase n=1 Tax=Quillaja saponaria TaxID=32244 RepID=A0AAD7LN95_QUISA|nr:Anthocyanin 5-aromatic acyltransferase [Quillaja saponaria]